VRADYPNHVWSYDFIQDRTERGGKLRMLCVSDEFTREGTHFRVARSIGAAKVIAPLERLFLVHGAPRHIRSDNDPELVTKVLSWAGVLCLLRQREWEGKMGTLLRFMDSQGMACWSRVDLESGEPVFISIAQGSVLVRRSRLGILGVKLYEENNIHNCVKVAYALDMQIRHYLTPPGMTNAVLRVFTQVALESRNAADLCVRIGQAIRISTSL